MDYQYEIDATLAHVLVRSKIIEARECLHCAIELEAMGYPTIAAWEKSLSKKYLREARIVQGLYK